MFGSSTKKIIISTILFLLATWIFGYGLFVLISKSAHKMSEYEIQQHLTITEIENDRTLKTFLKNSGPDIDRLTMRVVSKDGTVGFIEMIEKIARDNNLSIDVDHVKVSEAADKEHFETLNLSLSTEGSWNDTYTFLSLLETIPYKIMLNQVGVTLGSSRDEQATSTKSVWNGAFTFTVIKYK